MSLPRDDAFRRHADARLFDAAGAEVPPAPAGEACPDPADGAQALARALAAPAFRIGGDGPPPEAAGHPVFETLTAGSLGTPRRIRRSHVSWIRSFAIDARAYGIGPGCQLGVLGAFQHSLPLYAALLGLHRGASVHHLAGLSPRAQRRAMEDRRIAVLMATPVHLGLLVDAASAPLPALRRIVLGGAALAPELRHRLQAVAPAARITTFYGAAETSFLTRDRTGAGDAGLAYPGVRLQIRDAAGQPLGLGQAGEIWAQSPYLFESYAGPPGPARWQDGWLSVGEVGALSQSGRTRPRLTLLGRGGRMVTIAGENVFPEAIEAFLLSQPGVRRVAVLSIPDARRGARLTVVLDAPPEAGPALRAALLAELGALRAPARLVFRRTGWPLLASGKTDLRALQAGVS